MDLLTRAELHLLLEERQGPCVSLFMPTHRGGAEADPILWKNQVSRAEELLRNDGMRNPDIRAFLQSAWQLQQESTFWKQQSDGLAAFVAPQLLRLYRLPTPLPSVVATGKNFLIKPLLPLLSGDGRFFVLALSQNGVRLLQGTRFGVSAVDLQGTPTSLAQALLAHDRDEMLTFHSRPAGGAGSWGAIFSGHGVGIDDKKDDLLLYFQKIDHGLRRVLRGEHAPLLLAAVEYLRPIYSKANSYAHFLDAGLEGSPDRLSERELHERAWAVVGPRFAGVQAKALAQFEQLAGTGRTSTDLAHLIPAASRGEVETLFVAQEKEAWGRYDAAAAQVEEHAQMQPGDEDLTNVAAIHTLRRGGTVYVLPAARMPAGAPLAAVFSLPLAKRGKRP